MKTFIVAAAAGFALTAGVAAAQQPSRSADQIVCELTGDCAPPPGSRSDQLKVPAEAAFSFAKSRTAPAAAPARARPAQTAAAQRAPRRVVAPASGGIDMRITFNTGSASMTPQGRVEAQQFARALAMPQLAGRRFVVEGHTDAVGSRDYNLDLSKRRAEAVASYLASLGVASDRLDARGYGFDKPLPGAGGYAAGNRRVQFVPAS
ncbi:OmpA family protein [Sphingomonas sp. 1P06PA]|uniref:OmpA family protein n=1 Tax=Sphingomonas sp. 1P06PA TaxID=554121 RepID=UPI0039A59B81